MKLDVKPTWTIEYKVEGEWNVLNDSFGAPFIFHGEEPRDIIKDARVKHAGQLLGRTVRLCSFGFNNSVCVTDDTGPELYSQGDLAEYTGRSEWKHGGLFYEIIMREGHLKGQARWTGRAPKKREG